MMRRESNDGSEDIVHIESALRASEEHFNQNLNLLAEIKDEGGFKLNGKQVTTRVMQLVLAAQKIETLAIDAHTPHDPIEIYRRLQSIYFSGVIGLNYCADGGKGKYNEERSIFLEGFRTNGQKVADIISSRTQASS